MGYSGQCRRKSRSKTRMNPIIPQKDTKHNVVAYTSRDQTQGDREIIFALFRWQMGRIGYHSKELTLSLLKAITTHHM